MKKLIVVGLALLGGCSGPSSDPCSGKSGICVGVHVVGNATGLQQLAFSSDKPMNERLLTPSNPGPIKLPIKVALLFPAGTTGPIQLGLDGLDGASGVIAHADASVPLASGHTQITMTLDNGGTLPDMEAPADLHSPPPDMTVKPNITVAITGQTTVFELDTMHLDIKATDPLNLPLSLTITATPALPKGVMVNSTGGVGTFDWIPGADQAGMYQITFTALSLDGVRMAKDIETLTIKNTVDFVPNVTPGTTVPPPHLVGDFDKDGFADIAYCTVAGAVAPSLYTIYIVYGDAMPLPNPVPAARTVQYTFNAVQASMDNIALTCEGGDFNGDGFSDIVITDPNLGGGNGGAFILFGKARANNTSTVLPLKDVAGVAGEQMGLTLKVGDFNNDTFADIALTTDKPRNAVLLWFGNLFDISSLPGPIPYPSQNAITWNDSSVCGSRQLLTAADVTGSGNLQLLLWDPNVGAPASPPSCLATFGGLRTLAPVPTPAPIVSVDYAKPSGKDFSFGHTATLCDVDRGGDNRADLVVSYAFSGDPSQAYFYFTPFADLTAPFLLAPPGGLPYTDVRCAPGFFGPQTIVLAKTGGIDSGNAGQLDLVTGGTMSPFVNGRAIVNPDPTSRGFGAMFGGIGDYNGDAKTDLLVGSKNQTDAVKWWVEYSR